MDQNVKTLKNKRLNLNFRGKKNTNNKTNKRERGKSGLKLQTFTRYNNDSEFSHPQSVSVNLSSLIELQFVNIVNDLIDILS